MTMLQIVAMVVAGVAALLSVLFFVRLRWPAPVRWFLKLYIAALSPVFLLTGLVCMLVGLLTGSMLLSLLSFYVVLVYFIHISLVTQAPDSSTNFKQAFGEHWESIIDMAQKKHFLPTRRIFMLPRVQKARMEQDIPFAIVPGTNRKLLCDIWQPAKGTDPSGLAFIYLHGSAFYFLDKDFNTRPFFNYLASQGHVIMDVAYRLAPETDMMGMVNDVKRAIVWMKENAATYGVNPDCIVVGGGSAGGHLACLAAYTYNDPRFTPGEQTGKDVSVAAVVSIYGSYDLEAIYYHTNQHLTTRSIPGSRKKAIPTKMPGWIVKKMGKEFDRLGMNKGFENVGTMPPLMGGHPDECPERYAFFSPVNYAHEGCPPTLLIHDEDDIMAPVESVRILYSRLKKANVLTVMHILPQLDHGFDLILPVVSPSAHTVFYDVERFLAMHVKGEGTFRSFTKTKDDSESRRSEIAHM